MSEAVADGFVKGLFSYPVIEYAERLTSAVLHGVGFAEGQFLGKAAINGAFFYVLDSTPFCNGFKLAMVSRIVFSQPQGIPRVNMDRHHRSDWTTTGYVVCAVSAATACVTLGPTAALYTSLAVKDFFSWITHEPLDD